jgi:hypothetical protein
MIHLLGTVEIGPMDSGPAEQYVTASFVDKQGLLEVT